jgi:hypothetical protein
MFRAGILKDQRLLENHAANWLTWFFVVRVCLLPKQTKERMHMLQSIPLCALVGVLVELLRCSQSAHFLVPARAAGHVPRRKVWV